MAFLKEHFVLSSNNQNYTFAVCHLHFKKIVLIDFLVAFDQGSK